MLETARTYPQASFVCIGQKLNPGWVEPLWSEQNIYYLGDKHYSQMPAYVSSFDICMIPYSVQQQHGGDPIKFYEYLAMLKPVVTTNIGGVSRFADFPNVRVANDYVTFTKAIGEFLARIGTGQVVTTRQLPVDVLWPNKADQMIKAMLEAVSHKG
jgi:glycosyltransferase involved in cell wall biosynthesis